MMSIFKKLKNFVSVKPELDIIRSLNIQIKLKSQLKRSTNGNKLKKFFGE